MQIALRAIQAKTAEDLMETRGLLELKTQNVEMLEARIRDLMAILSSRSPTVEKTEDDDVRVAALREKLANSERYYEGQLNIKDNVR